MKTSKNISIRNAKYAKIGLMDMCKYIRENSKDLETLIEIGSYVGDSSAIFAKEFKDVTCVDPWLNGYDDLDPSSYKHSMSIIEKQFDENIVKVYSNVKKIKDYSENYSKSLEKESIDIIYIDGIHTYDGCKNDIEHYLDKVKPGGFIAGHDYDTSTFPGVVKAVNEKFGKPDMVFRDTSWIVRKK